MDANRGELCCLIFLDIYRLSNHLLEADEKLRHCTALIEELLLSRQARRGGPKHQQLSSAKTAISIAEEQHIVAEDDELDLEGRQAGARNLSAEQKKRTKWRRTGIKAIRADNRADAF